MYLNHVLLSGHWFIILSLSCVRALWLDHSIIVVYNMLVLIFDDALSFSTCSQCVVSFWVSWKELNTEQIYISKMCIIIIIIIMYSSCSPWFFAHVCVCIAFRISRLIYSCYNLPSQWMQGVHGITYCNVVLWGQQFNITVSVLFLGHHNWNNTNTES